MDSDALSDRLLDFGVRITDLVEVLPTRKTANHCGNQLLRCGTSPGANYEEARAAESKDDFVHKCQVVLKELRESRYWLRAVERKKFVEPRRLTGLLRESMELVLIFSKSVATAKGKAKQ